MIASAGAVLVMVAVAGATAYYWEQSEGVDGSEVSDRSAAGWAFGVWLAKGAALPVLVLGLLCSGWLPGIPPLLGPAGGALPGSAAWVKALPDRLAAASAVMVSWWGAVTLAWLLTKVWREIEVRGPLRGVVLVRSVAGLALALVLVGTGGIGLLGFAVMGPLAMLLSGLLPLRHETPVIPLYSRAVGQLKLGHYVEAEKAVLEELERCPNDYEGWMLLAELYAEHFNDLSLAEQTVNELCDQPDLSGIQISLALHRLADWHLKFGQDPHGARRALAGIERRLVGSHFARMAEQRRRQLPADREELEERKQARRIPLPSLRDPLDDGRAEARQEGGDGKSVQARVDRLVQRLGRDPRDVTAREELARLLVERLGRVEEGMDQIRQLLAWEGRPPERVPGWLASLAAWHLEVGSDKEAARAYLEALVRDHSETPQALVARRRLALMDLARAPQGRGLRVPQKRVAPARDGH